MLWTSSSGLIELRITKVQSAMWAHPGPCDSDIDYLKTVPAIRRQLDKLDPSILSKELAEYGAWDDEELSDHPQNLSRILWIACGDIYEGRG